MAVDSQILADVNVAPSRRGTALTGAIHMARTLPTRRYPTTPLSTSPVSPPSPIATGRGPACPPRRIRRGSLRLGGRANPRRDPPSQPLARHLAPPGPCPGRLRQRRDGQAVLRQRLWALRHDRQCLGMGQRLVRAGLLPPLPGGQPAGPRSGDPKVQRGCSWLCPENYSQGYRVEAGMMTAPDSGLNNLGFRCAADAP